MARSRPNLVLALPLGCDAAPMPWTTLYLVRHGEADGEGEAGDPA